MCWLFVKLPSSFLPEEDQGLLITSVQMPVGATADRTQKVLDEVRSYYLEQEKDAVESVFLSVGFGFGGSGQNVGVAFVRLKDFNKREDERLSASAVARRAMSRFAAFRDGKAFALNPPAIQKFGNNAGFSFYLQDINGAGHKAQIDARDNAERSLYDAEDSLLQSQTSAATDHVALSKALGGGWTRPVDASRPEIVDGSDGRRQVAGRSQGDDEGNMRTLLSVGKSIQRQRSASGDETDVSFWRISVALHRPRMTQSRR